ncbi:MAG TPA: gluconate 2-dehydrogenase subunit 3 family protein, partial [Gemmatimonadaceae bacterium]
DCYDEEAQQRVVRGLAELTAISRARAGGEFAQAPRAGREALLRDIDAEAQRAGPDEPHWFATVRELAERAYFSSEIGTTQALRWVETPGRWEGCVPLRRGQPAWA